MGAKRERRKKVGRPPKPQEEQRRNRVVITLTDADLARLHRVAEEKSLPLASVAAEFVIRALRRRK